MTSRIASITLLTFLFASEARPVDFSYRPAGDLKANPVSPGEATGDGHITCINYIPGAQFPLETGPAFLNSQVYSNGGRCDLPDLSDCCDAACNQCSSENFTYPWRDNFCESRGNTPDNRTPFCPNDGIRRHHQGQDIRAATCENARHWVVAVVGGEVTHLPQPGEQWVDIEVADGIIDSYLHMTNIQVADGQIVTPGTRLGQVSNQTGTTVHLHFERRMTAGGHSFTPVSPYIALVDAYRKIVGRIAPGYRVRTTATVSIRQSPAGSIIATKPSGSLGTVIGNTQDAIRDGFCYVWKQVEWGDGLVGYVEDNYLVAVAPNSLVQVDFTGSNMVVGSSTNAGAVTFKGMVTSPEARSVALEIEVRPKNQQFTGVKTHEGPLLPSGTTASICASNLPNGEYHWQGRVRDSAGNTTPWRSFGDNSDSSADFSVQATVCALCVGAVNGTSGIQAATSAACGSSSFEVQLDVNPISGTAPLNDVDLTASVSGSSSGTTNYTFYCNRSDAGTNITSGWSAKFDGTSQNPKSASNICDYPAPGTYTAKVIVERGSEAAEARRTITVGTSSFPVPEVATLAATSVTQASVTFNATVHPKNSTTTYWFDYGTTTNVSQSTTTHTLAAATSQSSVSISQGGLSCGQQYFFRARASSAGGSATPGAVHSFTIDACGSGGSGTVQLVADPSFEAGSSGWWVDDDDFYIDDEFSNPRTGNFYAHLSKLDGSRGNNLIGGVISPHLVIPEDAADADLRFWYSITSDETTTTTVFDKVDVYLVRPPDQLNLITTISNLDENGTSYSLESKDISSSFYGDTVQIFFAGSTDGSLPTTFRIDDVTLEVDLPSGSVPAVTTQASDQITASSARLNMTVDPNGGDTTVWFDFEAGDSTPNDDTEHLSVGSGSQSESVSISVFGLECGTTYHFRANAQNEHGSDQGSIRSFTTSACSGGVPNADTDPADNVTQTSATLTADVDPNGLPTRAWFAWGNDPSFGQETPHLSVGSGAGNVDFSQTITGLQCGTTYYFENHAENSAGEDDGATLEFTTDACDSGGPPAQGFFLEFQRQGCSGGAPAVLLWWTAPTGTDSIFTVHRTDGEYTATVNSSSQGGMTHVASSLLVPGEIYDFFVEGTLGGVPVQTNVVTVPVLSDECRLPVGASDLPHLPLVWTGTPFCNGGTASVPVQWTAVGGAASYTLTRIDNVAGQLTPFPNLTGTSLIDNGLRPGAAYEYSLEAVGSGGRRLANRISVFVPSGVCAEPSTPGPFSVQVSAPACAEGKGAVTLSWTASAGATSSVRTYHVDEGFTHGSGNTSASSRVVDGIRPGALIKFMVQRESASMPGQYRSIILAQRIPLEICGGSTLPPTVTTTTASYIHEQQALLRASILPNGVPSTVFFEWGTTAAFGSTTPIRNAGDGQRSVNLGEALSDLTCGTTYHYRAVAINANGRTNGTGQTFTTATCPPAQCSVDVVVSPASGVNWAKNIPQRIRWAGSTGCVHFAFRLLRGGVHDGWIDTASRVTDTEYEWAPEPWLIPGSNVQLEVTGFNAAGHGTSATSSAFNLVNPSVLPSIIFLETGPEMSNWRHEGWASTNTVSHSPSFSRTDSQGLYQNNTVNTLSPPRIDLSGRQSAFLTFWHRFELAAGDSANVVAKTDQGSWVVLRTFTGMQTDWRPVTVDLSGFAGQPVTIGFQLRSDASATADGWYVDDILVAENSIFVDGFETGDLSRWSARSTGGVANGNSIEVPNGAFGKCGVGKPNTSRFGQSCGARMNITGSDSTPAYVQDNTPFYEGNYRMRAYVNLRTLQMQNGDSFELFAAYDGVDPNPPAGSGNAVVRLVVQQASGGKQLIAVVRTDVGAEIQSAAHPLSNGWRSIEISWTRSTSPGANNGRLDLWIDGAAKPPLTGLDSDLLVVNYTRWGAVAGLDEGTSGAFWFDDFISQRTSYIGPAFPFSDNPTTSSFFPFIQGVYAAEVMPGCAIGSFCPADWITRKEMARFILLAKFGANFTPPACTTPLFSDVPCSDPYAPWINEMANQGISAGCGSGRFCPDGNVSRAQMAVFLMVAVGATPTPCPPSAFSDIPASSSFCPWIKEIATRGITSGCGGGNFCPDSLVSRGQMAVFLATAFNLPRHLLGP